MRSVRCLLFALGVLGASTPVSAQIINFDNLPGTTGFLPQGYAGFNWLGEGDVSGNPFTSWLLSSLENLYQCPTNCQLHEPVSGTQNAWTNASNAGTIARSTPFDFLSVFMAGTNLQGDPNETLHGYRGGVEVYTAAVALDPSLLMRQYTFNFLGVDSVRFDGRNHVGNLLVDDIAYGEPTTAPEPATLALVVTGVVGVAGVAGRRRRRPVNKAAGQAGVSAMAHRRASRAPGPC